MENEEYEQLSSDVSIVKFDVCVMGNNFDKIIEENVGKNIECLVGENDELMIGVKLHKSSDLYKVYYPHTTRSVIHTNVAIQNNYKKWGNTREDFMRHWGIQMVSSKKKRSMVFVTGDLYKIRMLMNNHNSLRNIQLKKVTVNNNTKSIMGFHIHDRMITLVKQIT